MIRLKLAAFFFALASLLFAAIPAHGEIHYRVSLADPDRHFFHVNMTIPPTKDDFTVAIPAWNALYQIRDFAYRVEDVTATELDASGASRSLPLTKLDKQTWRIVLPGGHSSPSRAPQIRIEYAIYWDDPGPFNSQLNAHHAFINLAEVLFYLPDRRAEASTVEFADLPPGWKIAMELPGAGAKDTFAASGYDALVDAPVEMGEFQEFAFDSGRVHYRVVVDGGGWSPEDLGSRLRRIVDYETALMGGAPFAEYTFFLHLGPYTEIGGGGMEHSNCTAIAARSAGAAVHVAAHEFFHAWNVKRIRPQTLEPIDYSREMYTRALWFAEGVTSTYASYALLRSGLASRSDFYADLAAQIGILSSRPAHHWQSAEESSLDAWLEKYDFYSRPDASISYYNKGQILGYLLDLVIRDATDNRRSLDDLMRAMNDQFAKRGRLYRDSADIQAVAEHLAGRSLDDFFRRYVSGTEDIPYEHFLNLAGWRLLNNHKLEIEEIAGASEKQRRIREGLLAGRTD